MTHKGSLDTSGEGERAQQEDARARWDRPALQRLSAIDAEILTKEIAGRRPGQGNIFLTISVGECGAIGFHRPR